MVYGECGRYPVGMFVVLMSYVFYIDCWPCRGEITVRQTDINMAGKVLQRSFDIRNINRYTLCIPSTACCQWYMFVHTSPIISQLTPAFLIAKRFWITMWWARRQLSSYKFSVICTKCSYVLWFTAFQDTIVCTSVSLLYDGEYRKHCLDQACIMYYVKPKCCITCDWLYVIFVYTPGHFKRWWFFTDSILFIVYCLSIYMDYLIIVTSMS